jgi:putative heme-binding domain-containing protein
MPRMSSLRWLLLALLAACATAHAQQPPAGANPAKNNPHLGNRESIRSGMTMYRVRCADCHGLDAKGYRGPDLTALLAGGEMTDERLFDTIRKGVPGTDMPASQASDDELLLTIAYLRNLSATPTEAVTGNVDNGARIFTAQCANCHRVGVRGGRIGPDLTRIGVARSRASLVREIRNPSEWMAPAFETVTIVTRDGQRVRGVKKNEDVFSIQIMDTRERIQGYLKADLKDVIYEKESLMPVFGSARLNDGDLNDLVGYLSSLRGGDAAAR